MRSWRKNSPNLHTRIKICALAKWLKASPHWLHYGENEKSAGVLKIEEENSTYGEDALITLPEDFQRLIPILDQQGNIVGRVLPAGYGCRAKPDLRIIFLLKEKWNDTQAQDDGVG